LFLLGKAGRFAEEKGHKDGRNKDIEASHRFMPPEISFDRGAETDTLIVLCTM
jgi:hypothetical protein